MSRILAIHNSHNASICETEADKIIYFQEAERLDKVKKTSNWIILLDKYKNNKFDKIIFVNAVDRSSDKDKNVFLQILKEYNIECDEFVYDISHHFYHACASYYNSGYDKSFVLIIDGHGIRDDKKLEIVSCYYFYKNKYKTIFKVYSSKDKEYVEGNNFFINTLSLGHFYTMTKEILNYKEEGSVMGLSSYGNEIFTDKFFTEKFNHFSSVQCLVYNMHIESIKDKKILMCRTVQRELERIVLKYVSNIIKNKQRNLCVSGGVFQNTVLNSKILDICPNLYVDPFADDSGMSMGAALFYVNKNKFKQQKIHTINLGDPPDYSILKSKEGKRVTPKDVANLILEKNIVAIYQGRNELGKRALGNRSFLFDPRDNYAKEKINYLKNREWFRPTAGTVLHEHAYEWFDLKSKEETPFMSYVFDVKRKEIPGITHIDNTCRIQTLKREENYHYYNLINEFYKLTNVPILLNTSFNLAGQPLVNSVGDAISTLTNCNNKFKFIYFPEIGKIYTTNDFI